MALLQRKRHHATRIYDDLKVSNNVLLPDVEKWMEKMRIEYEMSFESISHGQRAGVLSVHRLRDAPAASDAPRTAARDCEFLTFAHLDEIQGSYKRLGYDSVKVLLIHASIHHFVHEMGMPLSADQRRRHVHDVELTGLTDRDIEILRKQHANLITNRRFLADALVNEDTSPVSLSKHRVAKANDETSVPRLLAVPRKLPSMYDETRIKLDNANKLREEVTKLLTSLQNSSARADVSKQLTDEGQDDIDVLSLSSSEGTIDMDMSLDTTDIELDEEDEEAVIDTAAQNLAAPTPPTTAAVAESSLDATDYSDLLARTDINVASTSRADRVQHIVRACVGDRHAMIHTMSKQIFEHYIVNKQVRTCAQALTLQDADTFSRKMAVRSRLLMAARAAIVGCVGMYATGSTVNGCGAFNSDMDLCAIVHRKQYNKRTAEHILRDLKVYLEQNESTLVSNVVLISARVPILKINLRPPDEHLEIDVNINNVAGVYNSYLCHYFSLVDERFPALALLIKHWAINAGVIDAQNGKINSYSLVLMVIHYLQCAVHPPVLPNLFELFPEQFDETRTHFNELVMNAEFARDIPGRYANKQSLGELLLGFFIYYDSIIDYDNEAISIREATLKPRAWMAQSKQSKQFAMFIEEPYDRRNTARCVLHGPRSQMPKIRREFRRACERLLARPVLEDIGVHIVT